MRLFLARRLKVFFLFVFLGGLHVRACESEGTACVVVSGSQFESLTFYVFFGLHVRPRTSGHVRAKERPVWVLFLARGLKVIFFVLFCFLHVRPRTYGHVLVRVKFVYDSGGDAICLFEGPGFSVALLHSTPSHSVIRF